jgi:hypothetical protein
MRSNYFHTQLLTISPITAIPALLLIVIGPMMAIGAFTNFSFPKRRKFPVPSNYMRRPFDFYQFAPHFNVEDETEDG